jgi:hypothetical protein
MSLRAVSNFDNRRGTSIVSVPIKKKNKKKKTERENRNVSLTHLNATPLPSGMGTLPSSSSTEDVFFAKSPSR